MSRDKTSAWKGAMKDLGGRPREYASHAERQAAYRARKAREGADVRDALAQLRLTIQRARRTGKAMTFDPRAINAEHEDSVMLRGIVQQIHRHMREEKLK